VRRQQKRFVVVVALEHGGSVFGATGGCGLFWQFQGGFPRPTHRKSKGPHVLLCLPANVCGKDRVEQPRLSPGPDTGDSPPRGETRGARLTKRMAAATGSGWRRDAGRDGRRQGPTVGPSGRTLHEISKQKKTRKEKTPERGAEGARPPVEGGCTRTRFSSAGRREQRAHIRSAKGMAGSGAPHRCRRPRKPVTRSRPHPSRGGWARGGSVRGNSRLDHLRM